MEQLPLELISRIVYYLDDGRERLNSEKLSQWAILNESWREAVETILFRKLNIAYDDFSMFTQAFAGPRSGRRLKLQSLHITLRAGADEATCITQLSSGMRGFWKELGSWGRSLRVSHLHFCFDCHILSERRELYTKKDLDAAFDPPPLNWVNSLRFTTNEADFPPVLMAALVNRLPALENLWIQGRYQEKRLRFAETEMSFRYSKYQKLISYF
jgi:hypothetical protein